MLAVSDNMRASIIDNSRQRAQDDERARIGRFVRQAAAIEESAEERALASMVRAIGRHVHRQECDGGCRRRCVTLATKSSDRKLVTIDDALAAAAVHAYVVLDGADVGPGAKQPS